MKSRNKQHVVELLKKTSSERGLKMLEIERKFLYSGNIDDTTLAGAEVCLLIIQWYLSLPDARRLRLVVSPGSSKMIETVKTGSGLVREEKEREIPLETLHEMACRLANERAVVKARYVYPRKRLEGVIDRYFVPNIGLRRTEAALHERADPLRRSHDARAAERQGRDAHDARQAHRRPHRRAPATAPLLPREQSVETRCSACERGS